MHLRSIALKGFKSFPDRTRLEFTPGVSVIVGPNGSGKSNITDAVLWALGEQSPIAVRGQSMQDVIFAGAHGVQARGEAEVEIVLDNADGAVALPAGEISVSRRLTRAGDGEYRINGARCRLGDVIELMSDTGMGKEMHSVVSQGRVEGIVTSKPRDRRMLIEEAAGLGKHRKRRRRAQLKLERTQVNLDRALDVEREARTRLRPLKRQAEAAELHARLERQTDEARWALAREDVRAAGIARAEAEAQVAAVRAAAEATERELAEVGARRERAEQALASRGSEREGIANRFYAARSAGERIALRQESARQSASTLAARSARRRELLAALEAEAAADPGDDGTAERIAGLESELAQLAEGRKVRLERELAALESRRAAAAEELNRRAADAADAAAGRSQADAAAEAARRARRAVESEAEAARREAASVGSELAKVNQFLRSHAGAPGGATALADGLSAASGYELALAAALGPRLRAAVAGDLPAAAALLDRAGRDGGASLVVPDAPAPPTAAPAAGAERLLDHVRVEGDAAAGALVAAMLADAWVVEDPVAVGGGFMGIAVTRDGRVWSPREHELRQVPPGGEDRVLAERNRRDALIGRVEAAAQAEQAALARVEEALAAVAAADGARDDADRAARETARAREDAAEAERHARRQIDDRRRAPDEGASAVRRAELESAIATERRLAERAERDRAERAGRVEGERGRLAREAALIPQVEALIAALAAARAAVDARVEALGAELEADRQAGETLAAELRSCAQAEAGV
ncbi:MAG: chromosome segregation protein, partial [Solirubrobacteraceae bacterium]|nr:chromosome segregation protein [Solirubrobacteraceae bacterium]